MDNLIPVEYQDQRILTTAQLAESYETTGEVISNNFNRNIERYQEGKHYFVLEGELKREFLNNHQIDDGSKNAFRIYLWTEKGVLLHAKSLGTDKAWEVYEMLIETYFNKQQILKPMTQLEIVAAMAQSMVQFEKKLTETETLANKASRQITSALDIFTTPLKDDWRHEMNEKVNQMCLEHGLSYLQFRHDIYVELESTARVDLNSRQLRLRTRMKKNGSTVTDCKAISKLDIIERDPKLKPIFEGIVRKYQAKYAVA